MNAEMRIAAEADTRTISVEEVRSARFRAFDAGRSWLETLQEAKAMDPAAFVGALSDLCRIPVLSSVELFASLPDFERLPYVECLRRQCVVLRSAEEGGCGILVLTDPLSDEVASLSISDTHASYDARLVHRDELRAYLAHAEQAVRATEQHFDGIEGASATDDDGIALSLETIESDSSPIVRLASSILYDALKQEASDIHLKSTPAGMQVRFRIDGVLVPVSDIAGAETAQRMISRIKVMSELDIAERRIPQDGRFRVKAQDRHVDFRVSIMPSIHGEDAVLRLLDRSSLTAHRDQRLTLADLAMDPDAVSTLRRLAGQPYGMVLVTGPTGSGKTTTLYAAIDEINTGHENIITIEDPVEYQLPGVLQIPVNEKKGLTFARGLRSILRHDPDKIMVGEIRDEDTAQIAVQAALTGHLVLTTVHANNVFDVVGRLLHMGVDAYSLSSALVGVWAQRLLRVNCPGCSSSYLPDAETVAQSGLTLQMLQGRPLRSGKGCGLCRGTGYKGRRAIAEYLVLNDRLRELIATRAPITSIRAAAAEQGGHSLRQAALALFFRGETTLTEVNRVTFAE